MLVKGNSNEELKTSTGKKIGKTVKPQSVGVFEPDGLSYNEKN